MGQPHKPRRGSLQFWPRKRSRHSLVRVRSWAKAADVKPLAFIAYKAGMTHVMATDNRAKSMTKGETIALPVSIIECPPMTVAGVVFYKKSLLGIQKVASVLADKLDKNFKRASSVPKAQ